MGNHTLIVVLLGVAAVAGIALVASSAATPATDPRLNTLNNTSSDAARERTAWVTTIGQGIGLASTLFQRSATDSRPTTNTTQTTR